MAYPPDTRGYRLGEDVPMNLETIQPDVEPSTLRHADLHEGNIAIGNLVPGDAEHSIFPLVKVRGRVLGQYTDGANQFIGY